MGVRRFALDTSRFLQQDFFAGSLDDLDLASDPLTMNRYALAGANPIGFVELDGHMVGRTGTAVGGGINGPTPRLRNPQALGGLLYRRLPTRAAQLQRRRRQPDEHPPHDRRDRRQQAREEFNYRYANLPHG